MRKITIIEDNAIAFKRWGQKSLFVNFKYDIDILEKIKTLPHRFYHYDKKFWEVPKKDEEKLNELFEKELSNIDNSLSNYVPIDKKELIKNITLPDFAPKHSLYEHQLDAIKFGLLKNSFIIGDEMGLGKTATIIHYSIIKKNISNYKHCLIICGINSLKFNWICEIENHSNEKGHLLGGRLNRKGVLKSGSSKDIIKDLNNLPQNYFLVINIESFRNEDIVKCIKSLVKKNEIEMIVIDEAHIIKNPSAKQSKALLNIKPKTRVAMTGTPIMNNPLELYPIFYWMDIDKHNYYQFQNHYAIKGGYMNYEIVGYKNLDELQKKLDKNMIRRLKKDILDLPEKSYVTEYLEMSNKQNKIYEEVKSSIVKDIDKIKLDPNPLASLIRLRQATADTSILSSTINESVKFDRLLQIAEELYSNKEYFVVMSNWSTVINKVYELLKKYKPAIVTGEIVNKFEQIKYFNSCKSSYCIVGTTSALGTGYNLTKASTLIFLDSPWSRSIKDQATDRIHRIGMKNHANIITLVCKNTIDERIEEIVYTKGQLSDCLVDFNVNKESKSKIIDYLLS